MADRVEVYMVAEAGALRAAIRGGNWNNGGNAGVFSLNLNNAPSNTNTNIGFRACKKSGQICIFKDMPMELYHDGAVGLNNIRQSIASWLGHAAHADTYNLRKKIFGEFKLMNNPTV